MVQRSNRSDLRRHRMKQRQHSRTAALVAILTVVTGAVDIGSEAAGATSPDPACVANGHLFVGDPLTCAAPHQPAAEGDGRYQPQGKNFPIAGKYGTPAVPPDPTGDDCHPVTGYGSLDLTPPVELYTGQDGRKIGRYLLGAHAYSGYGGPDGFFSAPLDMYVNPDGTGGFVGRELFEGTIDGRTGAMVFWVEGTFDHLRAGGRFAGYSYAIRGMEGLAGIQHKAYFAGVFGKGYEWVDGLYCWNGFRGMYDNDGRVAGGSTRD
jgi:hypothetical protein